MCFFSKNQAAKLIVDGFHMADSVQTKLAQSLCHLSFPLSLWNSKSRRRSVVCTSYSCTFSTFYVSLSSDLALITQTGPKNHNTFIANIISSFLRSRNPHSYDVFYVPFLCCILCDACVHMCIFFLCYSMLTFF